MRQSTFNNGKQTLYLVATPIGNLQDISFRAIEILKSVELIACEDTRETGKLKNHYNIDTPLLSCHEHNEISASKIVIETLKNGFDVAYVSDAGYPLISDPGSLLIKNVLDAYFNVSVIPGASAFITALAASNLDTTRFTFFGFLNSKQSARKKELIDLKDKEETMIFYESPYRILNTLDDMIEIFDDRQICLARELTKKFEEYIRGTLIEVRDIVKDGLKGEIVLIVSGREKEEKKVDDNFIISSINDLINTGLSNKDAINVVAKRFNLKKNDVYNLYHSS